MIHRKKIDGTEVVRFHLTLERQLHDLIVKKAETEGIKRNGYIKNKLVKELEPQKMVNIVVSQD